MLQSYNSNNTHAIPNIKSAKSNSNHSTANKSNASSEMELKEINSKLSNNASSNNKQQYHNNDNAYTNNIENRTSNTANMSNSNQYRPLTNTNSKMKLMDNYESVSAAAHTHGSKGNVPLLKQRMSSNKLFPVTYGTSTF